MPNMATFLMSYDDFPLAQAPGGKKFLRASAETLQIGRHAFADKCASCHSSKRLAEVPKDLNLEKMEWRKLVDQPDFLDHNYLSEDARHSVLEVGTNAQRAEGTNAMAGSTWGQMSSQTYKDEKKEQIELVDHDEKGNPRALYNPLSGKYELHWKGSQAFYRTPTLVGIWATAPFFHNNSLGKYNGDPSVKGRVEAFEDGMEKMLWPEKRLGVKSIKITSTETSLPEIFPGIESHLHLFEDLDLKLLSFPKGTPINLVMSLNPDHVPALIEAYLKGVLGGKARTEYKSLFNRRREAGLEAMRRKMLELNTCPDFIEDRGHTYGADLSDNEKRALIEYMKTF
jgi:cytochrome c5